MITLIVNGIVVDPANSVMSKQNLLIKDGRVVCITDKDMEADEIIDASNKYVCPGFIDIHMHEDSYNQEIDEFELSISYSMLRMGVTTAMGGNCGSNAYRPDVYLSKVDEKGFPINLGLFVGHSTLRNLVGDFNKYSAVDDKSLKKMQALCHELLDSGCFGVSYGIRYIPGITHKEIYETALPCQEDNKIVSAHVRDDAENVFSAMKELIDIGKELQIPVQNSHIGSMGGFGQMSELLSMIDRYKVDGLDISSDCYPYYAFSTGIGETTYDDGFLERYKTDYSCIEICEGKYKGQRCNKEIFDDLRKNYPNTLTVCHVMKKEDVDLAICHPNVMVASDGLLSSEFGHPRAAGTFPKFINNFVKSGKLSLYEAIKKITVMPADKLKLNNKGRLSIGADADIVIFDLDQIDGKATFDYPTQSPTGIDYVLINGKIAVKDGQIIDSTLGKSLRR